VLAASPETLVEVVVTPGRSRNRGVNEELVETWT
jgi:hypothetical protein